MNYSLGPFNLYTLLIVLFISYILSFYLIIKNKLSLVAVFIVFLFPFLGAIGVIIYSIVANKYLKKVGNNSRDNVNNNPIELK